MAVLEIDGTISIVPAGSASVRTRTGCARCGQGGTDGEETTSGLGRNGPWLQNRWLRVETRQDDGSISPVALDGAFRRPSARWRTCR